MDDLLKATIYFRCQRPKKTEDIWKAVLREDGLDDYSETWLRQNLKKLHLKGKLARRKSGRQLLWTTKNKEDVERAKKYMDNEIEEM